MALKDTWPAVKMGLQAMQRIEFANGLTGRDSPAMCRACDCKNCVRWPFYLQSGLPKYSELKMGSNVTAAERQSS